MLAYEFQLVVHGRPHTKGSLTAQPVPGQNRVRLVDSEVSRVWRRTVAAGVRKERQRLGRYGPRPMIPRALPVVLALTFLMPGDPLDIGQGDLDKLERNVLDALSGCSEGCGRICGKHSGLYADDAQVVKMSTEKLGWRTDPGVVIQAWAVRPE